ncbi:Hydrolase, NUDIX family protein (Modular protein) [Planktothrix serta PCC 8927]|uniref:Hydrolase, NUDIX family protein (Modular protein) n=1 Tax=Planktothrix serta PCC 8927 TaxID=671068 RepID=A0A7Z9BUK9_9CYAN|nr:NUDIX hydrolase [Planktothrix serta]VXD23033.1 Hydrolase, NUDIX family protein (Modular protein) [Planktothrix serta PCC 8927]
MFRNPISTRLFVVVVVRSDNRFLLIQEVMGNRPWYFPGGRVEPGETFVAAAKRETLEEAGIPIILEGILRIQHLPHPTGQSRIGVFFLARPEGNTPPKTKPDHESLGAKWFTLTEVEQLPLRTKFVKPIIAEVLTEGAVYPLQLILPEGNFIGLGNR